MSLELTLYVDRFWVSPYALSAFVALEEKGLKYEVREVGLDRKEHHRPEYQARTGRVPSLQHGELWLAESQAIAEYLAETFPAPKYPRLFPESLKERAVCREVMAWLRSDLVALREERPTTTLFYRPTRTPLPPLTPQGQAAADRLIAYAQSRITEGRTSLFAHWCIADTDLALMLQRLNLNADALPAKLKAYAETQWARPSVKKWCDHVRPPYVSH